MSSQQHREGIWRSSLTGRRYDTGPQGFAAVISGPNYSGSRMERMLWIAKWILVNAVPLPCQVHVTTEPR